MSIAIISNQILTNENDLLMTYYDVDLASCTYILDKRFPRRTKKCIFVNSTLRFGYVMTTAKPRERAITPDDDRNPDDRCHIVEFSY